MITAHLETPTMTHRRRRYNVASGKDRRVAHSGDVPSVHTKMLLSVADPSEHAAREKLYFAPEDIDREGETEWHRKVHGTSGTESRQALRLHSQLAFHVNRDCSSTSDRRSEGSDKLDSGQAAEHTYRAQSEGSSNTDMIAIQEDLWHILQLQRERLSLVEATSTTNYRKNVQALCGNTVNARPSNLVGLPNERRSPHKSLTSRAADAPTVTPRLRVSPHPYVSSNSASGTRTQTSTSSAVDASGEVYARPQSPFFGDGHHKSGGRNPMGATATRGLTQPTTDAARPRTGHIQYAEFLSQLQHQQRQHRQVLRRQRDRAHEQRSLDGFAPNAVLGWDAQESAVDMRFRSPPLALMRRKAGTPSSVREGTSSDTPSVTSIPMANVVGKPHSLQEPHYLQGPEPRGSSSRNAKAAFPLHPQQTTSAHVLPSVQTDHNFILIHTGGCDEKITRSKTPLQTGEVDVGERRRSRQSRTVLGRSAVLSPVEPFADVLNEDHMLVDSNAARPSLYSDPAVLWMPPLASMGLYSRSRERQATAQGKDRRALRTAQKMKRGVRGPSSSLIPELGTTSPHSGRPGSRDASRGRGRRPRDVFDAPASTTEVRGGPTRSCSFVVHAHSRSRPHVDTGAAHGAPAEECCRHTSQRPRHSCSFRVHTGELVNKVDAMWKPSGGIQCRHSASGFGCCTGHATSNRYPAAIPARYCTTSSAVPADGMDEQALPFFASNLVGAALADVFPAIRRRQRQLALDLQRPRGGGQRKSRRRRGDGAVVTSCGSISYQSVATTDAKLASSTRHIDVLRTPTAPGAMVITAIPSLSRTGRASRTRLPAKEGEESAWDLASTRYEEEEVYVYGQGFRRVRPAPLVV